MFRVEGLGHSYGEGVEALQRVNLNIEGGSKVAILGNNGAGKTTLLLHLNGVLRPSRGRVYFKGEELEYKKDFLSYLRSRVGMVFQHSDDQLFAPTVLQDVAFGPLNQGLSREEGERKAYEALESLGIKKLADRPPHLLSEGQKKRVAIAGVLALDPEAIIMDEPLANLDSRGQEEVKEIMEEMEGKTIVFSTHDPDLAYGWADYIYLLHMGGIVREGKPEEVFTSPDIHLPRPLLVELYEIFSKKGLYSGSLPGSLVELLGGLEEAQGEGSVEVSPCDRGRNPQQEYDFLITRGIEARIFCHRRGIRPQAITGGVERSLLRAWAGDRCLVIASRPQETREEIRRMARKLSLKVKIA